MLWALTSAASPVVTWDAPAPCPTAEQGRAMIEANLGASLDEIETDAAFVVVLSQTDRGWGARIDLDASSSRTLPEVDTCEQAGAAAALVVAIALDPAASGPPADPRAEAEDPHVPAPEPEPEPAPAPEPAPEPVPEPEPEPERDLIPAESLAEEPLALGGHLGIAGGLRYGSLDRALGIVQLRGGLLLPRARVSLEAVVAPRRVVAVDTAEIRFTQWGLAAGGCWRIPLGAMATLEPCAAAELGQTWSSTRGLDDARPRAQTWFALRGGPHLTWRFLPRTGLWAGVEAIVPLTRPTYAIGGAGTVARILPVGVHAFAGVEIRFGTAR